MNKEEILLVSVTYRCSADCSYCYTKNFKSHFPRDMAFISFLDIVNNFIKSGGKQIHLIGGEPTIWEPINLAIAYGKLRGIKMVLLTNALQTPKIIPHVATINISHYLDKKTREIVLRSLKFYQKKRVGIYYRYNVGLESEKEEWETIRALARKIKPKAIDIVPQVPYENKKEIGKKIYQAAECLAPENRISFSNPMPPCLFSQEQLAGLKKISPVYFVCQPGRSLLIHPDAETMQPCTKLFFPEKIRKTGDFFGSAQKYKSRLEEIKCNVPAECVDCPHYREKKCFGGCLAFRK